jgi:DNA invertase Pin-like site-specific DNA recombinase
VATVNGESKISASHRSRIAMIYIRQSTMLQVREHTESTARQYGLAGEATRLGWAPQQVEVVDVDLGVSGRFGADRSGFRQLIARVCLGEVGAIFGLEVSRLARSSAEFARLLELARLTDTLVVDSDGVYDLSDINDRLLLGLKGSMSEVEIHLLTNRMQGAKRAAAARGDLRHPLPVGLVYDDEGHIVLDPDEQVRQAVADVFAEFAATGSAYGVVAAFAHRRFPLRAYGGVWDGTLRWGRLTHGRTLGVLRNPAYAGAYAYGKHRTRRVVRPDGSVITTCPVLPRDQWAVLIEDHHPGYIPWTRYLEIEAKLAANRTSQGARPPREGEPLCQGIIGCGLCGHRVGTRYQGQPCRAFYDCMGHRDAARTGSCRSILAEIVDTAVADLLLARVSPEHIRQALAVADELVERQTRACRAAELALERARYEADRADRAFHQVDPDNRLVARTLEARWEARLAALTEAETTLTTVRDSRPHLPEHDSLLRLAENLPRLWHDPATSVKDRKRLLRTVISDVTLLPDNDRQVCRIGVRWHTGATDEITAARPVHPGTAKRTPQAAVDLVKTLGPTHGNDELVDLLNQAGLRTGTGRPFDIVAVQWVRHAHQVPVPAPQTGDELSVKAVAARLGISADAVYTWIANAHLEVRRTLTGRICVPWNDRIETACRRRIAASAHLKPTTPTETTNKTAGGAV